MVFFCAVDNSNNAIASTWLSVCDEIHGKSLRKTRNFTRHCDLTIGWEIESKYKNSHILSPFASPRNELQRKAFTILLGK